MASTKKKKRKVRVKPIPVIILLVIIIAAVVSVTVLAMKKNNNKQEETKNVSMQGYTINQDELNSTTVKIDMEDCKVPVGTTLIVTATITPEGTQNAINWTSSNNAILTIDSEGVFTAKAPGMAVITATVGIVSDTVIIECVEPGDNSKSQLGLPMYGEEKSDASNEKDNGKNNEEKPTVASNEQASVPVATQAQTVSPTKASTVAPTAASTASTKAVIPTTAAVVSKGLRSSELHSELSNIGYSERVANVYSFGEGDNYYGQVIIQSDLVIIYIKQRSDSYDAKIKSILAALLPEQGTQVWNNYVSSYSDRTFTAEGRRVRIVSAAKGGHSQIVIYN